MVKGAARVRYSTRMPTSLYSHLSREQVVHPILCGSTMNRPATLLLVSDFGRLQGILVGVPLAKIEPQYDDKGKRISRLLTWSTGETCLVTG